MTRRLRQLLPGLLAVGALGLPFAAPALHTDDPSTLNMHALGHDVDPTQLDGSFRGPIHTDLAFQSRIAV